MRLAIVLALVSATALAQPTSAPQPLSAETHAQIDVPRARAQQVIVQSRDFPPGGESGWHTHPGTEIAYIAAGRIELQVKGKTTVLEAGDSFTMPRGVPHNGVNRSDAPTRAVITLVVDKGAPVRQPAKKP